jgi:hypothetical protein
LVHGLLGLERKSGGLSVMSDTITLAKVEELFSCEDSDEALESAAGKEIAAGYTLLYCTSQDCSMVS